VLEISTSSGTTTISVVGDLDVTVRDQFPEATARVAALGRHLMVLDLCRMDFMDSTGAAFVAAVAETTHRSGGVAMLRGADEQAAFVLDVCGVLPLFRVDDAHACEPSAAVATD
jgi:anti-sigma B factor antagonist